MAKDICIDLKNGYKVFVQTVEVHHPTGTSSNTQVSIVDSNNYYVTEYWKLGCHADVIYWCSIEEVYDAICWANSQ